ncbi:large subunit GTPase 1 homolog isoform X2 [Zophobas morio]|uniref:large subunit GTPase 1 homolog isoform X2 n=1 Tax=Zophobas morio TaxID=2755281 RepID=UPI0030834D42
MFSDSQIDSSGILTRSELLHKLKNSFTGNTGVDKTGQVRPLTFGMVGYPNVGKSSTINALLKCNKVSVSATPGKTKHFQTHYLDSGLLLMDCPGLVFPNFVSTKAEMLCSGILPVDQLRDPVPPATLIAQRIPRSALESTYGLHIVRPCEEEDPERPATGYELLHAFGNARGFMTSHGLPEVQKSARILIKDYIKGKLLYCHPPPGVPNEVFNPHLFSAVSSGEKTVLPANENTALLFSTSGSITKDKYNYQSLAKAAGLMGDTRFWGVNIF